MSRGERISRTKKVVKKRLKALKKQYRSVGKEIPSAKIGRCRKHHPNDCGHTKCYCCHADKIDKIPTQQKKLSDLDTKEQCQ